MIGNKSRYWMKLIEESTKVTETICKMLSANRGRVINRIVNQLENNNCMLQKMGAEEQFQETQKVNK